MNNRTHDQHLAPSQVEEPLTAKQLEDILLEASVRRAICQMFGSTDLESLRDDMKALHAWRKQVERIKSQSLTVAIGLLVTSVISTIWLGFKEALRKSS